MIAHLLYPVPDLRSFLTGRWRIARRISDARLGIAGRLTGYATFTPSSDGLIHEEMGELRFGGYRGSATRRYQLMIGHASACEVRHADGSLFHHLDLASGRAEILHRCGCDIYQGHYRVLHGDRFAVTWQVKGPRKQYRLSTVHVRFGGGGADSDE